MPAVFIAQMTLTQWSDAGKVRVEDTTLVLIKEQRTVDLTPAVRFTELEFGDEDPNTLLGKVKTVAQLKEMGAEHMMNSVIYGDMAYKVVEGFMGDLTRQKPIVPQGMTPQPTGAFERPSFASRPAAPPSSVAAPTQPPQPAKPAAPAPVPEVEQAPVAATPEPDAPEDDAEALSKLFLDTVQ
jgi:hypothetical protein